MGHFPDSVKRPVLTRGFEESLIAVFKAFGWQAKFGCAVRARSNIRWQGACGSQSLGFFGRAIATVCDGVVYYF